MSHRASLFGRRDKRNLGGGELPLRQLKSGHRPSRFLRRGLRRFISHASPHTVGRLAPLLGESRELKAIGRGRDRCRQQDSHRRPTCYDASHRSDSPQYGIRDRIGYLQSRRVAPSPPCGRECAKSSLVCPEHFLATGDLQLRNPRWRSAATMSHMLGSLLGAEYVRLRVRSTWCLGGHIAQPTLPEPIYPPPFCLVRFH